MTTGLLERAEAQGSCPEGAPKGLNPKAQGREAHPGLADCAGVYPEGVARFF